MDHDLAKLAQRALQHQEIDHQLKHVWRRRCDDFRVFLDNNGVLVMGVMAVGAKKCLAHRHEAGDFKEQAVQPFRPEGRSMARLVLTRLRAGGIENAVARKRDGGKPAAPQHDGDSGEPDEKSKEKREIPKRAGVLTLHQCAKVFRINPDPFPSFGLNP